LSKVYGQFVRSLTKLMQKKLADGNSVSEAALGSMSTVRSFDAAESELGEFEKCMKSYLDLNMRSAVAYCGYAAFTTAVPELVFALVGKLSFDGRRRQSHLVHSQLTYFSLLRRSAGEKR
jgi:ABC-type multidrug transport system fused ATPase/permease subunit